MFAPWTSVPASIKEPFPLSLPSYLTIPRRVISETNEMFVCTWRLSFLEYVIHKSSKYGLSSIQFPHSLARSFDERVYQMKRRRFVCRAPLSRICHSHCIAMVDKPSIKRDLHKLHAIEVKCRATESISVHHCNGKAASEKVSPRKWQTHSSSR